MITFQEATAIVEDHLSTLSARSSVDLAVDYKATREEPWCWVFFYNSAVYLETGSFSHALTGNGPIVVEKEKGVIHELVSSTTVEQQLAKLVSNQQ